MSFQSPKFTEEGEPPSPGRRRFFKIFSIVALAVPGSRNPPPANVEATKTETSLSSQKGITS